jgi:tRNA 2-selenouridine synthase
MAVQFDTLADVYAHGFDTVIDVRTPDEFAEDHMPGAINLPVLTNAQRAEVGTIYVQDSRFRARKLGASLVARNAADHIDGPLAGHDGAWKPLVYCWRGGQRSGSFTSILQQIGWRADVVAGGYQTYRRLVHQALYLTPLPHRFVLLDGNTGTAKTAILAHLADMGVQVIDLEGLANHRGSLLGGMPGGQPSQKGFESALAHALMTLDPIRPVVVEAESSKIGQIALPSQVWALMKSAPRIEIAAPPEARARFLTEVYRSAIDRSEADPTNIAALLDPLRSHRGHATVDHWQALLKTADYHALALSLMTEHYDPSYTRSRGANEHQVLARLHSETLDIAGQTALARQVADVIETLSGT